MRILLNQNKEIIIDDEDYDKFLSRKWYCAEYRGKWYVKSNNKKGLPKQIRLHRFLTNAPDNSEVDHINGNTLDNRKSNLRFVNRSQNMMNQKSRPNRGVSWHRTAKKWRAYIVKDYKQTHLGLFDSLDDAKMAYRVAAKQLFGEYSPC